MPKKIFAVTNVKVGQDEGQFFAAGEVIDRSKFSDKQLKELHNQGAIEVRTVDDEPKEENTLESVDEAAVKAGADATGPTEAADSASAAEKAAAQQNRIAREEAAKGSKPDAEATKEAKPTK